MSQAPASYIPAANFHTLAAVPYTETGLPGGELDAEFANLAASMLATQARLAELQRDDGAVRNGVVGLPSLSADVLATMAALGSKYRGPWAWGQIYDPGDVVILATDNYPYMCMRSHVSGLTFEGDFSVQAWGILGYRPTTDTLVVNTFSGTGSQTTFTLTKNPVSATNTQVYIAGVYQKKSAYTVSATVLTFAAAPAVGTNNIEVVIGVSAQLINNVVTIPPNSVGTAAVTDAAVTTVKMADGSVTAVKLADLSVATAKLADGAVTTAKLAALSVTAEKLAGASIDSTKMAVGSVQSSSIQAGAVIAAALGTGAVTSAALGAGAVVAGKLAAAAVVAGNLAAAAVVAGNLATAAVVADSLAAGSVTAVKLGAGFPVQVVQSVLDASFTPSAATTWTDITGLSVTLTRARTTSKVRIQAVVNIYSTYAGGNGVLLRIMRDSTPVGVPAGTLGTECTTTFGITVSGGANVQTDAIIDFIDALPTDALAHTYKLQMWVPALGGCINSTTWGKPISTLTLTEITI